MNTAVQVTVYLNEADTWHHAPLYLELLRMLREESVAGAVALHAVAGFLGRDAVHRAHLVDAARNLPVVVIFVDLGEHVERVMPRVLEMAAGRLVVRENVVVEHAGTLA